MLEESFSLYVAVELKSELWLSLARYQAELCCHACFKFLTWLRRSSFFLYISHPLAFSLNFCFGQNPPRFSNVSQPHPMQSPHRQLFFQNNKSSDIVRIHPDSSMHIVLGTTFLTRPHRSYLGFFQIRQLLSSLVHVSLMPLLATLKTRPIHEEFKMVCWSDLPPGKYAGNIITTLR